MSSGVPEFDPEQLRRAAREVWTRLRTSRRIVFVVLSIVVAIATLVGSYYQVEPDEVGMVTRFGRFVRTTSPGPHGKLPFGIEQVQKVPVERQLKQEFGFRTVAADIESHFRKDEKTAAESLMLTGDLNVATVEWIVQYKISDPYKYLFKLRDVEQTFRLMAEASMRTVVGDHSVTELLTVGREAIAAKAKELLSELCKRYDNGISVQQLVLAGRRPARAGQAVVQRGQPGDPGARARHQRGVGRIQPGDPARARARRAEDPGVRRLRRRPREPRQGRRAALHRARGAVPQGARGDAHAPLPGDAVGRAARRRARS